MSLDPVLRRRVAWLLFVGFLGLYGVFASGRLRLPDEQEVYFQAESLVDRGELAVPQAVELKVFFGKTGRDGKVYAPYGPGTAFFVLPHYLAARGAASALQAGPENPATTFYLGGMLTSFATAFYSALAVALMWLVCLELGAPPRRAFLVAISLGTGTLVFSYATLFFSEGVQVALLLATLLALLRGRMTLAGFALAGAVLCKAPTVILAPGFAALAYFGRYGDRPSFNRVVALAWPVVLAACVHLGWNSWRFYGPMDFGYDWSETMPPGVKARGFSGDYWRGLVGLTVSPGKGLLFFAPPVLLGIAGLGELYSRERATAIAIGVMGAISFLFWPHYVFWAGGYCIGPRQILPLIPFLLLPACFVDSRRGLIALTVLGCALQLLSVTTPFLRDQSFGPKRLPALEKAWEAKGALEGGDLEEAERLVKLSIRLEQTPEALLVLQRICEERKEWDYVGRLAVLRKKETPSPFTYYYDVLEDPPLGQPRNRYNLLYAPWKTLPPRFSAGLLAGPTQTPLGEGIENWYLFAKKLRRSGVFAGVRSFEGPLGLLFLSLLGGSLVLCWRGKRRLLGSAGAEDCPRAD